MLKTISLKKLIAFPKLKMKKHGKVYDKEWNTWFSCEEERQDFIRAIYNQKFNYNKNSILL